MHLATVSNWRRKAEKVVCFCRWTNYGGYVHVHVYVLYMYMYMYTCTCMHIGAGAEDQHVGTATEPQWSG